MPSSFPLLQIAIGNVLRELRESQNMSKRELSTLSGINRSFLRGAEKGEWGISVTSMFRLCDNLDVPPDAFVRRVMRELEKLQKG